MAASNSNRVDSSDTDLEDRVKIIDSSNRSSLRRRVINQTDVDSCDSLIDLTEIGEWSSDNRDQFPMDLSDGECPPDDEREVCFEYFVDTSGNFDENTCDDNSETIKTKKGKLDIADLKKVLTFDSLESETTTSVSHNFTCFNCNGYHTLTSCPEKLDYKRIAINRANHFNRRQGTERYIDKKKPSKFEPGKISVDLQRALGIGPQEIPEWIYRMRRMGFIDGYPPGYLKKALPVEEDTDPSDILEFHTDNVPFGASPVTPKKIMKKVTKLSMDKLIKYPGFNFHIPGLIDLDGNTFSMPSINDFLRYHQANFDKSLEMRKQANQNKADEVMKNDSKKRKGDDQGWQSKRQKLGYGNVFENIIPKKADVITLDDSSDEDGMIVEDAEQIGKEDSLSDSLTTGFLSFSPSANTVPTKKKPKNSEFLTAGGPFRTAKMTQKPSLEAFAKGIVPFEPREECSSNRGFYDKFIKKIRNRS